MRNIQEKDLAESVRELGDVMLKLGRQHSLRDPISTAVEELQFTAPQVHTMIWLGTDGALTMGDLASRAGVDQKTITGVVDRLEREDYVSRERSEEDRRVVHVRLTRKGSGIYKRLQSTIQQRMYELLAMLDSGERRCLIDIFKKITNCLSEKTVALLKAPTKSP